MENCLGWQVATGSYGQSSRGVTGEAMETGDLGGGLQYHSGLCYMVTCAT